jgi:RHS repeat-associated protein
MPRCVRRKAGSTDYLPTPSGPMPIAAVVNGTNVYGVHSDHLNTPRRLTRSDGQVVWQWAYSAFGDEEPTTGAKRFTSPATNPSTGRTHLEAVTFNLRYPGQVVDGETGLSYNYFRSYDSRTGRYTQGDPIGLQGGWNRFGYVGGNALSWVDPRGLDNPGMGPYGPGGPNRGDGSSAPMQAAGAMRDFLYNYDSMRTANTIGGDKYFHCMANCQATRRGPTGEATACLISDVREWTDQSIKGDPTSASLADQAANAIGRSGALSSSQSCRAACSGFRPAGLPSKY